MPKARPDEQVQGSGIQSWAAMDVPECLMCGAAFHQAKAGADRLEPHHRPKIRGWAEAQVELESKWID
jgi:hypothetical protein